MTASKLREILANAHNGLEYRKRLADLISNLGTFINEVNVELNKNMGISSIDELDLDKNLRDSFNAIFDAFDGSDSAIETVENTSLENEEIIKNILTTINDYCNDKLNIDIAVRRIYMGLFGIEYEKHQNTAIKAIASLCELKIRGIDIGILENKKDFFVIFVRDVINNGYEQNRYMIECFRGFYETLDKCFDEADGEMEMLDLDKGTIVFTKEDNTVTIKDAFTLGDPIIEIDRERNYLIGSEQTFANYLEVPLMKDQLKNNLDDKIDTLLKISLEEASEEDE